MWVADVTNRCSGHISGRFKSLSNKNQNYIWTHLKQLTENIVILLKGSQTNTFESNINLHAPYSVP